MTTDLLQHEGCAPVRATIETSDVLFLVGCKTIDTLASGAEKSETEKIQTFIVFANLMPRWTRVSVLGLYFEL